MNVLLTFLGTNTYYETTYTWHDGNQEQENRTKFVAEALNEFLETDTVKVFLTKEARNKYWDDFQNRVPNAEEIAIPSGQVEDELWEIFEAVVNSVKAEDKVVLDVTHSFRSIPLFVFLAGLYLQKASDVEIQGVYYGAYERDRERSPIFDLTPTLTLIDWLTATDKFINTGSATELGELLANIQRDFYRQGRQKHEPVSPRSLISFGNSIQAISESIELVRPLKLMNETAELERIPYDSLKRDVGQFAHPFTLLLDRIQADYGQFALSNPRIAEPHQALMKQFDLLHWYIEKSLSAQAILLGREWVVSALCVGLERDYLNNKERKHIEQGLNELVEWTKDKGSYPQPFCINAFEQVVPNLEALSAFWSKLRDMRNDLAHTEMRQDSLSASTMTNFVRNELETNLQTLFKALFPN